MQTERDALFTSAAKASSCTRALANIVAIAEVDVPLVKVTIKEGKRGSETENALENMTSLLASLGPQVIQHNFQALLELQRSGTANGGEQSLCASALPSQPEGQT